MNQGDKSEINRFQLMGIQWKNDKPYFELFDGEKICLETASGDIYLKRTGHRYCIGTYELLSHKTIPCPENNSIFGKNPRCFWCRKKMGFELCLRCHGEECKNANEEALHYCNRPHFVYLAYFPGNVIKVGTAYFQRKTTRLLEQGAVYALIIAKCQTGQEARRLEYTIGQTGIRTFVRNQYKLMHPFFECSSEDIFVLMTNVYKSLRMLIDPGIKNALYDEPEFLFFPQIRDAIEGMKSFFPRSLFSCANYSELEQLDLSRAVEGEIMAIIGANLYLLIQNSIYAIDMKQEYGYYLEIERNRGVVVE